MVSTRITRFYSGEEPDHRGRYLREIQGWDDARLEDAHDYIQWLFPLPEPSPVNPLAPVLDQATATQFYEDEQLRDALRHSLQRMLAFLGFEIHTGSTVTVKVSDRFAQAAANWLTPYNHNLLRITRILRSTRLLGLEPESKAFFEALEELYKTESGRVSIGRVSFQYWRSALADEG